MILLSQTNKQWAKETIGKTKLTLGRWGCTITSICMILSKFYADTMLPPEAAKKWAFDGEGRILWKSCDFNGLRFVLRGYVNNDAQIREYASDAKRAVILEVNKNHWIAVVGVENGVLVIHDPIDGTRHVGVPSKYKVTGYALFEKMDVADPYVLEKAEAAAWLLEHDIIKEKKDLEKQVSWGDYAITQRRLAKKILEWAKS